MSDKKERIDHILTQTVTDNKDSARLNSLLYRDKAKEDKKKEKKIKAEENSHQNTSMLSFMWGDDGKSSKRKKKNKAKNKKFSGVKTSQYSDLSKQDGKTIVRESKDTVEISKNGISLKLSESEEGKLKLKISTGKIKNISKKRLAKIAMNAIIKELKKEE
ncbi:MAG: hypothetical protein KAR45_22255 [Desulfobacteraceae bacterium]|nr:hypothetical protein [Desulfobacteraceae bacterium]